MSCPHSVPRTPEAIELAIRRLAQMRLERERIPQPAPGESHARLLLASCEAIALDAAIDALKAQLRETEVPALGVQW